MPADNDTLKFYPKSLLITLLAVALPVLVIDQGTKWLALRNLHPGDNYPLLGDIFSLKLVHNPGAAFSFLSSHTWIFTIFAVIILGVIGYAASRARELRWQIALGMLAGGALGNLIDRLVQPPAWGRGRVVDFLSYGDFFVGNVADIFIVVAALLMVLFTWQRGASSTGSATDV